MLYYVNYSPKYLFVRVHDFTFEIMNNIVDLIKMVDYVDVESRMKKLDNCSALYGSLKYGMDPKPW